MLDIALAIGKILPAAEYLGSTTANTEAAWDAVTWTDTRRAKPTWVELEAAAQPNPIELANAQITMFMAKIQSRLDAFAHTRTYDDARSCVAVYLGCSNETFAAEAAYMQQAIVQTWEWSNGFVNSVLAGNRPMPESWDAFEAELDAAVPLVWPVPDTRVTAALAV